MNIPQQTKSRSVLQPRLTQLCIELYGVPACMHVLVSLCLTFLSLDLKSCLHSYYSQNTELPGNCCRSSLGVDGPLRQCLLLLLQTLHFRLHGMLALHLYRTFIRVDGCQMHLTIESYRIIVDSCVRSARSLETQCAPPSTHMVGILDQLLESMNVVS